MIPIHLTLRNFLSYREEATLDFQALSIACLSGDNGAGKSAILDAITWAIWGKARANNDRDIISMGELEMDVTFIFQLGNREYRIFRRRSFAGRASQTVEFDVREVGGSEWFSIAGDSVRETEAKIIQTLNMEYDTFVNSAFILQGRADSFTQRAPGERKRILGDILNLQEYDELMQMARDEEKAIRNRLSSMEGRIATLDEQLVHRPQLLADLEGVSAQLNDAGEKLDLAQQLCETLKHQLAVYERGREALANATSRAERESRSLAALNEQLAERTAARDELLGLITHADEIEAGVAEYERWRAEAARFAQALRHVQQQSAIQHEAEQAIQAAQAELRRTRDQLAGSGEAARKRLAEMERDDQRLARLLTEAEATAHAQQELDATRAAISQLRDERSTLQSVNRQLRERMNEIKEYLDTLQKGEADCPVCRRPLAPDDRGRIHAEWTAEGKALGDQFRANQQRCKDIDAELEQRQADEQRLAQAVQDHAARSGVIRQLQEGLRARPEFEQQVAKVDQEVQRLDAILAAEDYAHEARHRLAAAVAARAALDYDEERHTRASEAEARYAPYVSRKQDLDMARTRLEGVEQAITALAAQIAERQQAVEEARAEAEQLRATLVLDNNLPQRVAEATDEVDRLTAERNELWARQGGIERQLAELDKLEAERDRLSKEAANLRLDLGAYSELSDAFGRNGIQALIIESVLPELEDKANELLQRMASGHLRVSFKTQREALSSDRIIETLDIIIRDEHGERPYALYSGGEAFRINFAVRVALSKLLAKRAGANIDMLVIDEGFGTQDSRGRDGLIEALRSIEGDFRKILVITHIGEIRELFPTRIDVVKGESGSRITVS